MFFSFERSPGSLFACENPFQSCILKVCIQKTASFYLNHKCWGEWGFALKWPGGETTRCDLTVTRTWKYVQWFRVNCYESVHPQTVRNRWRKPKLYQELDSKSGKRWERFALRKDQKIHIRWFTDAQWSLYFVFYGFCRFKNQSKVHDQWFEKEERLCLYLVVFISSLISWHTS